MMKTGSELSDETLIGEIRSGNKHAYETIVRRYNERLYRIGLSIVKNDKEAEEVMQNSYVKAYQQLGQFKGRSRFSTWLTRIMINECFAHLKHMKRSVSYKDDGDTIHPGLVDTQTPETQLAQLEVKTILENAIAGLPQKYQTVFVMRELEEMSVAETASSLQITEENVKVRLHRAKELLKTQIRSTAEGAEIMAFHLTRCDRIVSNVMGRI